LELFDRLLAACDVEGARAAEVRIGIHWTVVVLERDGMLRAGLAATQTPEGWEHGRPYVREAGRLAGAPASDLAALIHSESATERSIGLAAINALLNADARAADEGNAEDLLLRLGAGKRVAVVGHFPFVDRLRAAAATCWVLELRPGPADTPADRAAGVIPQADVVAITAMTLLNDTFDALVKLPRPGAFVLLLGPSTPLSPILFDYGVDAISGTVVVDIPAVLAAVGQGANFRQIPGKRLLTLRAPEDSAR
jgi:hypothetical protein